VNPREHIGAIIKDIVEELMASEDCRNRFSYDVLKTNIEKTLKDLENYTDSFVDLRSQMRNSMRKIFDDLKAAEGGHIDL